MKILLHTCCAPCLIYPYSFLKARCHEITVFFYNPNIHPFLEFKKRTETIKNYKEILSFPLVNENKYGLTEFLQKIVFNESKRCSICYAMRLEKTATLAIKQGFDAFTTTLLYSKYQQHDLINFLGEKISIQTGIPFIYHDFREGWQVGIDEALSLNMYRQSYCGCIYSEQERYDKSFKKP
ncbi:MAG: epoxyqueuosine reductase QueH [Proteobacteria bacterium]|nr:epoxyqueuosine reductase QueH [Pseudomonadota bacterium]